MKQWIALVVTACVSVTVLAAGKGQTKTQYIKQQKEWAKKVPTWNPTDAELGARFDKLDKNGDGLLTPEEKNVKDKKKYVKLNMEWAKKDPRWNPTKEQLEAKFDKLDKDGDGLLTPEEEGKKKK